MEINHETPMTSNFGSWFRGSHIFIFIFIFSSKTLRLTKYSGKIPKKNYALFYVPLSIWTWISMIFLYSQWFSYCTLQPSSRACPRIQQTSCNCDETIYLIHVSDWFLVSVLFLTFASESLARFYYWIRICDFNKLPNVDNKIMIARRLYTL